MKNRYVYLCCEPQKILDKGEYVPCIVFYDRKRKMAITPGDEFTLYNLNICEETMKGVRL